MLALAASCILYPSVGHAAVKYWDGGGADNNWNTTANWDNDVLPATTDDVVFDGTAGGNTDKNCVLDASKTCASITFINYDGVFSFGANGRNLTVSTGNADFSGMSVTPTLVGTNAIIFTSTANQTFTPNPSHTYPGITKNATAGTLIFVGAVTSSGALTLTDGYIDLGAFRHSFASVTTGANFDGTTFGANCTLSVSGAVNFRYGTMTAGAGSAIVFNNTSAQNFTPRQAAGSTFPALIQAGGSTTTIVTYALTCGDILIQNGTLQCNIGVSAGNLTVNSGATFGMDNGTARTITVGRLLVNGNLNFGVSTLQVSGDSANLSNMGTLTPGTGLLAFTGATNHIFIPKASTIHPRLQQNGTGSTTIITNALNLGTNTMTITNGLCSLDVALTTTGTLTFGNGGILDLGAELTHSVGSVGTGAATGTLRFNTSRLQVTTGNADLSNVAITKGSGTLEFAAAGSQNFIPRNGGGAYPSVVISGGGTVTVTTNNLIADSLIILSGTYNCGAGRTTTVAGMRGTVSGNINFATGTLTDTSEVVDLSQFGTITRGTGTLTLGRGSGVQTLIFGEGDTIYNLTQAGAGGTIVTTRGFTVTNNLTVTTGTLNLGSGLIHHANAVTGSTTGTLAFGSSTLRVSGNATFTNLPVDPGTGTLEFIGTTTLTPRSVADTLPAIMVNGTSVTTATNTLHADRLEIAAGTFTIGSGLTASVASIRGAGTLTFGTTSVLRVYGDSADFSALAGLTPSTGTLQMTGTSAQTLIPHSSLTMPALTQNGSGGTTVRTHALGMGSNALTISSGRLTTETPVTCGNITGTANGLTTLSTLTCGAVTLTACTLTLGGAMNSSGALTLNNGGMLSLGAGLTHSVASIATGAATGAIDFGSSTLRVIGNADFTNIDVTAGTGALEFRGSAAQTFTPRANDVFPAIIQNGSGGTTVGTRAFRGGDLVLISGTFATGAFPDTVEDVRGTGNLTITTGGSLNVLGDSVDLASAGTIATTGTLRFVGTSGTQVFVPKASTTHPAVAHTGASTLRLGGALTAVSVSNSAGVFDFNSYNVSVTTGAFTVTNGDSTTFGDMSGRKLTIGAGGISLSGQNGNPLRIVGSTAECTLSVTGGTATATFAYLRNSRVSGVTGTATNSTDGGGNSGWNFGGKTWDGGGGDGKWSTAANWSGDVAPTENDSVFFASTSLPCSLDVSASVKALTFTSGYTGVFRFGSQTLTVARSVDLRSGGDFVPGSGTLVLNGSSVQTLIPRATADTLPAIVVNGAGATVSTNTLHAGRLEIAAGTFTIGSGLTASVGSIRGAGALTFGTTSVLRVYGDSADFSGLAGLTPSTGTLQMTGTSAQTLIPKSGVPHPALTVANAPGVRATITTNRYLSLGALTMQSGILNLGAALVDSFASIGGTGGTIEFATSRLQVGGATVDLRNIEAIPGSGFFDIMHTAANVTFHPPAVGMLPEVTVATAGRITTVTTNPLRCGKLRVTAGTLSLGAFTNTVEGIFGTGAVTFVTGTNLYVTGDSANFSTMAGLTPSTGVITFTGSSDQVLIPRPSTTHPTIVHIGTGTLKLDGTNLTCNGVSQTAGTLDLNNRNLTVAGTNNFVIGAGSSLAGIDGRKITVGGYAHLAGSETDSLELEAATGCTLAVTGSLSAEYAVLRNCVAAVSGGVATNSNDRGGNTG